MTRSLLCRALCNRDTMTDDTTFSIYIRSPTPSSVFPFGFSGPQRQPPPTPRLGGMLPDLPLCPPPSLPSLLHLAQTDPTSCQEAKACGAVERGCIPTLSSHRATHTHTHSGYTWIHNLYTVQCSVILLTHFRYHHDQTRSHLVILFTEQHISRTGSDLITDSSQTVENGHLCFGDLYQQGSTLTWTCLFCFGLTVLPCLRQKGTS